jgi:hypothetical protein
LGVVPFVVAVAFEGVGVRLGLDWTNATLLAAKKQKNRQNFFFLKTNALS